MKVYLYSAIFCSTCKALTHGITQFYLQLHRCLRLPRNCSPDGASTLRWRTPNCSLLLIYLSWKDERLSRPGWLTYSGQFTHISGHPSAACQMQDRESSPIKDRTSITVPQNQPDHYSHDIHQTCRWTKFCCYLELQHEVNTLFAQWIDVTQQQCNDDVQTVTLMTRNNILYRSNRHSGVIKGWQHWAMALPHWNFILLRTLFMHRTRLA